MMFPPPGLVDHVLRLVDARQRLVALYAVQATFQRLEHDREWNRWISETRGGLQLSKSEHDAIVAASARLAPLLKQQVKEAGGAFADSAAPGNSNGRWTSRVNLSGGVAEVELRKTFARGEILITVHDRHCEETSTTSKSDAWSRSGQGYSLSIKTRGSAQLSFDDLFDMYDSIAEAREKLTDRPPIKRQAQVTAPLIAALRRRRIPGVR
jgi:hypothetical protein